GAPVCLLQIDEAQERLIPVAQAGLAPEMAPVEIPLTDVRHPLVISALTLSAASGGERLGSTVLGFRGEWTALPMSRPGYRAAAAAGGRAGGRGGGGPVSGRRRPRAGRGPRRRRGPRPRAGRGRPRAHRRDGAPRESGARPPHLARAGVERRRAPRAGSGSAP